MDGYFKLTLNEQKFSVRIPNMYANILEFIDSYTIVEGYDGEIFNHVMKFIEDYWIIKS
ncbi:hypothetical protein Xoosp13_154 [Xanthomonas phage Xoo-sp13]|nr:hypothetical protein Xoosp13_154 [Xanthomonas phage Xoo-sp13]